MTDDIAAAAYWSTREVKKWEVSVTAGSPRKPTTRLTMYVTAKTKDGAERCAKENLLVTVKRPRFAARLAGPNALGCN